MNEEHISQFTGIKTGRLILRGLELSDNEQMAAIRSNPEVNKYINRQACLNIAEAEAFIRKIQSGVANSGWYYWAICLAIDNKLIGTICLWNIDVKNAEADLGYELLPNSQGKGIMSEALEKVIDFAFRELKFKKIIAITNQFNSRSVNLLEKFGFVIDNSFVNEIGESPDDICFQLVNEASS